MYELPVSVQIGEQSFTIRNRGDYRMVIDCFICLEDEDLTEQERILACLIIFYEDINDVDDISIKFPDVNEAVKKMFWFFNSGQPEVNKGKKSVKLIDWDKDSVLVCSAINNVAGTEIRALDYLHWWTFMAYYMAVNESFLSHIINIRSKIANGKKLEKHEKEFKAENPQYFMVDFRTAEEKQADSFIRSLWGQ